MSVDLIAQVLLVSGHALESMSDVDLKVRPWPSHAVGPIRYGKFRAEIADDILEWAGGFPIYASGVTITGRKL